MNTRGFLALFIVLAYPTLAQVWTNPAMERSRAKLSSEAQSSFVQMHQMQQHDTCKNDSACIQNFENVAPVAFENYINNIQKLYPEKTEFAPRDLDGLKLAMPHYGRLEMSSVPPEATVFLTKWESNEGETTIKKSYPVGRYRFRLVKAQCEETFVEVNIEKDELASKEVHLRNCR